VQRAVARPGPQASVIWKVDGGAYGHAAVDSSSAYFLSRTHEVTAVDRATGSIRWRRHTGEVDPMVGNGVALASDVVVAGDYDITAWNRTTGAFRWRFVPAVGFGPGAYLGSVTDQTVFAGSGSGQVHAVDTPSGRPRWMAVVEDSVQTVVYEPVLDGDMVFVSYTAMSAPTWGGVVALDASTGHERWRSVLPAASNGIGVGAAGKPLVVENLVLVANRDGSIHALARLTGVPVWVIPPLGLPLIPNSPVPQPPGPRADFRALARHERTLFAGSLVGYIVAYDLDSRRELWRHMGGQNGSIGFHMAVDAQALYFPSFSGRLTAVSIARGVERWRIGDWQNAIYFPPALSGDVAYASAAGGFYALRR
jgi:outer membrane protein assembly factor BamB